MMRGQAVLSSVFLAVLTMVSVQAQEHPNGYYFTAPMSLSAGYDQNFVVGSRKITDTVTLLTGPQFTWLHTTARSKLTLEYQPEGEIFARDPGLNAWNNSALVRFNHRINSRWSLDMGDNFLSTMDPTRALSNSLLLLPRGRFFENDFYSTLGYRINQVTKLSFRLDNATTTMELEGPLKGRLNINTTAGTVTLDRALTSKQKLSASYSYLHGTPLQPETGGSTSNVHMANLGYSYEPNKDLVIWLSGGGVAGNQTAFTGAAAVEKRFGELWTAVGYQRYLSFFGGIPSLAGVPVGGVPGVNGLVPSAVYQVATIRAWGKLTKRIGMDARGQRAMNGVDLKGRSIRSLIGQIRVDYKINERFTFFVRAEHYGQNINPFFETMLSRNRYFGGIEITLARPPQEENLRNKHGKAPEESKDPRTGDPVPVEEKKREN